MSERYTKKDATRSFEHICKMLGKKVAEKWNDVGTWSLDYNPYYGGYVVEEITSEHGSIDHPLGIARRSAREFVQMQWDIQAAIRVMESNQHHAA